jgi:hypothetical protein
MINNKTVFEFYLILRLIIMITLVVLSVIVLTSTFIKIDFFQHLFPNDDNKEKDTLMIFSWVLICFILIDERIKPAFIEFHFIEDGINIKTYNPHSNRWESPFVLFGYKKRIKELKITREDYTDYHLTIGKFGFRKELSLQKTNSQGDYQTSDINISLLRKKEYTNLISALNKFKN